jgi:hypothetical protein
MRPAIPVVLALLSGCAGVPVSAPPACPPGTEKSTLVELFMGRNSGDRLRVREADWARFLTEEITPRFPEGMSVQDAFGQWRDTSASGRLIREPAKVVRIVLPGDGSPQMERILAISDAYKARFGQQAVMRVLTQVCAGF